MMIPCIHVATFTPLGDAIRLQLLRNPVQKCSTSEALLEAYLDRANDPRANKRYLHVLNAAQ